MQLLRQDLGIARQVIHIVALSEIWILFRWPRLLNRDLVTFHFRDADCGRGKLESLARVGDRFVVHLLVEEHQMQKVILIVPFGPSQHGALTVGLFNYSLENLPHISQGFVYPRQWQIPTSIVGHARRIVKLVGSF